MATGRKVTSYQLRRQLGAHLGHIPAAAMASRTIPAENLSSIKILFVVLANLAHGVLAQETTAKPRIDYQDQVNRAISCFLLLSSPNSCRNLKKMVAKQHFLWNCSVVQIFSLQVEITVHCKNDGNSISEEESWEIWNRELVWWVLPRMPPPSTITCFLCGGTHIFPGPR